MDGDLTGRLDPQPDFIAAYIDNRYDDVVADGDAFVPLP
jgi:hypothetical protein